MKKKIFIVIFIILLIGIGIYFYFNKTNVKTQESDGLYANLEGIEVVSTPKEKLPYAKDYIKGLPESITVDLKNGTSEDLIMKSFDEGVTIEEVTNGKAKHTLDYQGVNWNGELYSLYVVKAENAELPGFLSNSNSGILVLEISGECTIENSNVENSCFNGFDSVIIIGDGKLTINGGKGIIDIEEKNLPIPALIIKNVEVVCDIVKVSNKDNLAYLQLGGTLENNLISVDGDICITDGILKTSGFWESNIKNFVSRGGMALIGGVIGEESKVDKIGIYGGKVSFLEKIPENTIVENEEGTIVAPELSKHTNIKGKGETLDTYVKGNPFYEYYNIEE